MFLGIVGGSSDIRGRKELQYLRGGINECSRERKVALANQKDIVSCAEGDCRANLGGYDRLAPRLRTRSHAFGMLDSLRSLVFLLEAGLLRREGYLKRVFLAALGHG